MQISDEPYNVPLEQIFTYRLDIVDNIAE